MSMERASKIFALALAASLSAAAVADAQDTAPISAAVEYERGLAALDAGQNDRAEAAFRAIVERAGDSPLAPRAFVRLVRILGQTGRVDQARQLIEKGKESYGRIPEVRDQLDALMVHLNARGGRAGKLNKAQAAQVRKRLAEMERQAQAARQAGDMAKAEELRKARAKLARRAQGGRDMAQRRPRPGAEEFARLREQQEAMIARAHELEDKGQTEEAYALRRAADELARKAEAARRPNNRANNKNGNNQRRRINRRLRELRVQLKGIGEKLALARKEGDEGAVAELMAVRENFLKESRQLEERLGRGKNKNKNKNRQLNQARKALKKARKNLEKAREKGKGVEEAEAGLARATKALAELEARSARSDRLLSQNNNQLERLSKFLREQGASEEEVAEQLRFARAEREARQALNKELAELRDRLSAEGLGEDALRKRLKERRREANREARERRVDFNKRLQERKLARREGQIKKELEGMARRMLEEGVNEEEAGRRLAAAERKLREEARARDRRQAEKRRANAEAKHARGMERRLKQARKRLENSGASEEEIARKLKELRARMGGQPRETDRRPRETDRLPGKSDRKQPEEKPAKKRRAFR